LIDRPRRSSFVITKALRQLPGGVVVEHSAASRRVQRIPLSVPILISVDTRT
jgi:hypothetical protein